MLQYFKVYIYWGFPPDDNYFASSHTNYLSSLLFSRLVPTHIHFLVFSISLHSFFEICITPTLCQLLLSLPRRHLLRLPLTIGQSPLPSCLGIISKISFRCSQDVFIYISNNGGCDAGTNGACSTDANASPWHIKAGNGAGSTLAFPWNTNGFGTSIKIAKTSDWKTTPSILQFEYTWTTGQFSGLYWDLSDLDGAGSGLVGTPFMQDNVKISPTGTGSGSGTCVKVVCPAGIVCKDAYNTPDQEATHTCPLNTAEMYLDLCEPTGPFNSKRGIAFQA